MISCVADGPAIKTWRNRLVQTLLSGCKRSPRPCIQSVLLRFIQAGVFGKLFVGREMLGPQRFGNLVLFSKPLSQIHQLAALGTKWTKIPGKPFPFLAAGRTFHFQRTFHALGLTIRPNSTLAKS